MLWIVDDNWSTVDSIQDPLIEFPASLAFDDSGRRLLLTNYALFTGEVIQENRDILDVFVDDTAAPVARPVVP